MAGFLLPRGHGALAQAFGIKEITYAEVETFTPEVIDFETYGEGPIDGVLSLNGVSFAERFEGMTLRIKQDHLLFWHEVLDHPQPTTPLRLVAGDDGHNLAVQIDPHWSSRALHPLGPRSTGPAGTGTLAVLFDKPVCFVAFRTGIDGLSRFGSVNMTILRSKGEGSLSIIFFDRKGTQIVRFMRSVNPEGPIAVGYMQTGQAEAQIAGFFIENLDLRGIALDDLRFDPFCPLKLF